MRAAVFEQSGAPWVIKTVPDPSPSAREMILKVGRCGICGSDLHRTSGKGASFPTHSILGHEYSGEVVALGKGVRDFRVGDLVCALPYSGCGACANCRRGAEVLCEIKLDIYMGGFAEFVRVAERTAVRLPPTFAAAEGAMVEPLSVGHHAVKMSRIGRDARALVLGAGAIGLAVVCALHNLGVENAVTASRSSSRAVLAKAMGSHQHLLTGDGFAERVQAALGGRPDVVYECVGAPGALDQCVEVVKPGGVVVSLGDSVEPDPISVSVATSKAITIMFSLGYSKAEFEEVVRQMERDEFKARALISKVITLDALPDTIMMLQRSSDYARVQVDPSSH